MRTAIGPRVVRKSLARTSAIERNSARRRLTAYQSQIPGQFFAVAKWRKTEKFFANQKGLVLKAGAKRPKFVQCTYAA
jgi:hypothetical protein